MQITLDHTETVAMHTKTFWFTPERPVRYVAGQFTELTLPHDGADERGTKRWFTLSSSPTERLIGITTGFTPGVGSTYKTALSTLQPGARLDMTETMGDFVLPKDSGIPIIFVAAGLGVTPIRSMVKWLLDTGEKREIQLIYAASTPDELAFVPLFKEYGLEFTPVITSQQGRFTTEQILALAQDNGVLVYLSGPEIMVGTLYKQLKAQGIAPERLVADYFPGYHQF